MADTREQNSIIWIYKQIKQKNMYCTSHEVIDFDKVKTLEDVIRILKALDVSFEGMASSKISDLVKTVPKKIGVVTRLD